MCTETDRQNPVAKVIVVEAKDAKATLFKALNGSTISPFIPQQSAFDGGVVGDK
jgi:hypothetical protein